MILHTVFLQRSQSEFTSHGKKRRKKPNWFDNKVRLLWWHCYLWFVRTVPTERKLPGNISEVKCSCEDCRFWVFGKLKKEKKKTEWKKRFQTRFRKVMPTLSDWLVVLNFGLLVCIFFSSIKTWVTTWFTNVANLPQEIQTAQVVCVHACARERVGCLLVSKFGVDNDR